MNRYFFLRPTLAPLAGGRQVHRSCPLRHLPPRVWPFPSLFLSQSPGPNFPTFTSPSRLVFFLLIRSQLIIITPSTFTLCSSSSPLWLLPSRGHRPTLDPSSRRRPLETSCLSAKSFHPSRRPTRQSVAPSFILPTFVLLRHEFASLFRPLLVHQSCSKPPEVAVFTSADRCARCRICGRVNIVVRHKFLFSFILVLDLLHYVMFSFHLYFG